jgi:hypothetical protein
MNLNTATIRYIFMRAVEMRYDSPSATIQVFPSQKATEDNVGAFFWGTNFHGEPDVSRGASSHSHTSEDI